jgi:hypothetical protein
LLTRQPASLCRRLHRPRPTGLISIRSAAECRSSKPPKLHRRRWPALPLLLTSSTPQLSALASPAIAPIGRLS